MTTSASRAGGQGLPAGEPLSEAAIGRLIGRALLLLAATALAALVLAHLTPLLLRLFLAAILASAMTPPVDAVASLLGRWRWAPPRAAVVLALYLVALVLVAVLGVLVLGPVVVEARSFVARLPGDVRAAVDWYQGAVAAPGPLRDLLGGADVGQPLAALAQQLPGAATQALGLLQYLLGAAFGALSALMVLLLALYLTIDAPRIRDYLVVFLPVERRETAVRLAGEIAHRLGGWARGQVLLCAIIGALSWGGLTALGVPYALMLALVAGLMEAVPTVGPILSAVPAVGVALTVSPWHGAAVVVLCTAIQQLENYLIVPRVMSRAVAVHPLVVLVALMAGAELLGPSGVVLAVPLAAALAVVVDELRRGRVASAAPTTGRLPAAHDHDGSPPERGPGCEAIGAGPAQDAVASDDGRASRPRGRRSPSERQRGRQRLLPDRRGSAALAGARSRHRRPSAGSSRTGRPPRRPSTRRPRRRGGGRRCRWPGAPRSHPRRPWPGSSRRPRPPRPRRPTRRATSA